MSGGKNSCYTLSNLNGRRDEKRIADSHGRLLAAFAMLSVKSKPISIQSIESLFYDATRVGAQLLKICKL